MHEECERLREEVRAAGAEHAPAVVLRGKLERGHRCRAERGLDPLEALCHFGAGRRGSRCDVIERRSMPREAQRGAERLRAIERGQVLADWIRTEAEVEVENRSLKQV